MSGSKPPYNSLPITFFKQYFHFVLFVSRDTSLQNDYLEFIEPMVPIFNHIGVLKRVYIKITND